ncbi:MAG: 2-oxoacid:acceptor oxidoreductase subunit alpha, partial [Gaiellaceae bacterium]
AVDGPASGDVLVLGWGGTHGAIATACHRLRDEGRSVSHAHLRHLNPFPANTGDVVASYSKLLVPELNTGQLTMLLRARFLVDAECYSKVQGHPIGAAELEEAIRERL